MTGSELRRYFFDLHTHWRKKKVSSHTCYAVGVMKLKKKNLKKSIRCQVANTSGRDKTQKQHRIKYSPNFIRDSPDEHVVHKVLISVLLHGDSTGGEKEKSQSSLVSRRGLSIKMMGGKAALHCYSSLTSTNSPLSGKRAKFSATSPISFQFLL